MKKLITAVLILVVFCFAKCKKDFLGLDDNGLPPATQTGANTLGFLLNGQPWVPEGPNNLSVDYDIGFNNGIITLVAYRKIQNTDNSVFAIGIIDSLRFLSFPKDILIGKGTIAQGSYSDKDFCDRIHFDTAVFRSGSLKVAKFDMVNRIFAGTFSITLFNSACGDTIKITQGRFDMRF
jgi:hypothetical protein